MHQLLQTARSRRGFTLLEILVAVVVVGVFGAIAASAIPKMMETSKRGALSNTLSTVQQALDRAYAENGAKFPTAIQPDSVTALGAELVGDGSSSMPEYLLSKLNNDPRHFDGMERNLVVHYGVTCGGLVFATQASPTDGAWGPDHASAQVFTAAKPDGSLTLDNIKQCNGSKGDPANTTYTLTLEAKQEEVTTGTAITVVATVTSGGVPVSGVNVIITATGSVTGEVIYGPTATGADGKATFNVTSSEPEYILIAGQIQ